MLISDFVDVHSKHAHRWGLVPAFRACSWIRLTYRPPYMHIELSVTRQLPSSFVSSTRRCRRRCRLFSGFNGRKRLVRHLALLKCFTRLQLDYVWLHSVADVCHYTATLLLPESGRCELLNAMILHQTTTPLFCHCVTQNIACSCSAVSVSWRLSLRTIR